MSNATQSAPARTFSLHDVYFIVFRHKWKIAICTVLGLGAAVAFYFLRPPPFVSNAKLLIRYVMENTSAARLPGSDAKAMTPDLRGETIMQTETEILGSLDLVFQVVDTVGPDKILAKVKDVKKKDRDTAAATVVHNLTIEATPGSTVIDLTFRNPDPSVVQPVLNALIEAYFKKHQDVHDGAGTMSEFFTQEADQFHSRVTDIEDQLRKARLKAGVASIDDSKRILTDQQNRIQQEMFAAQAEFAERSTLLETLTKRAATATPKTAPSAAAPAAPPSNKIDEYRQILSHLDSLQKTEQSLRAQFTDENQWVKDIRAQVAKAQSSRDQLEKEYPALAQSHETAIVASGLPAAPALPGINIPEEAARLAGLQTKINVLKQQLAEVQSRINAVEGVEGTIADLQRQKELEEANYKYYLEHLEATRIDETLGANRPSNISEIQTPSPPAADTAKLRKTVMGIAAAGLGLGLAWACLIEFYFDRSIRRPEDVERGLRLPLFLSIPEFGREGEAGPHVFFETLRDRLIAYFESKNLIHKPKLIAVTSVGRGAGVTTTATGLAQCLSETGEGNVLLVDMTKSQGAAQQFSKGKAVLDLDQLLETRNEAQVQEKLFVVSAESKNERLSRALPGRFHRLVPQLKASDFDYIIFDMPSVNQISITPRLAGFMDFVLFVAESEKTDREIAKQAAALLNESRTNVGAVLNRTKHKMLTRAHHEFLGGNV